MPHLQLRDQTRYDGGHALRECKLVRNKGVGVIAGVEEEEAAHVALIETAGRGAQPAEFPGPSREHLRVHFLGMRILALDEVVPLSQYRCFANKDAAQGPLEIYVALEGWSEPASELCRQMERS